MERTYGRLSTASAEAAVTVTSPQLPCPPNSPWAGRGLPRPPGRARAAGFYPARTPGAPGPRWGRLEGHIRVWFGLGPIILYIVLVLRGVQGRTCAEVARHEPERHVFPACHVLLNTVCTVPIGLATPA